MKGWFKALGDAGRAIGYYHDAEARRSQAALDSAKARAQLAAINNQQMGDQAFGTVAGDVLGGGAQGGSSATPGFNPGAPSPGNVPMPGATQMGGGQIQMPPRANPGMVMAPQGSAAQRAAMPSGPMQGPPMPQGMTQMPQSQGMPQGMPQGQPGMGGPQQGQITWPQLFSALQRKGITNPQVIAAVVDRFQPYMNDTSKLQAQLYKAQIGFYLGDQRNQIAGQRANTYQQNADTTQQFDQARVPIMQQDANARTTSADASASRAQTYGVTAPILAQAATTRASTGQERADTDKGYKGTMASVAQQKANTDQSYKAQTGAAATTRAQTGQQNAATAAKRVDLYGESIRKQRDWNDPKQRPQPKPSAAAQLAPADKVKLTQLIHADSVAAANYRAAVAFGGTDTDAAKAAQDAMNKTGQALAAFQPSAAPAGAAGGFQAPQGAPDAKGQADGSILRDAQGNAVAKAQGGAWVAP